MLIFFINECFKAVQRVDREKLERVWHYFRPFYRLQKQHVCSHLFFSQLTIVSNLRLHIATIYYICTRTLKVPMPATSRRLWASMVPPTLFVTKLALFGRNFPASRLIRFLKMGGKRFVNFFNLKYILEATHNDRKIY
jgi:hypothetical protein